MISLLFKEGQGILLNFSRVEVKRLLSKEDACGGSSSPLHTRLDFLLISYNAWTAYMEDVPGRSLS